jgi:hypothetical protein
MVVDRITSPLIVTRSILVGVGGFLLFNLDGENVGG